MATVNLLATSEYVNGGWVQAGTATAYTSVQVVNSSDGYVSYFKVGNKASETQYDLIYEVDNTPADTGTINSVTQYGIMGRSTTGCGTFIFRHDIGGTTYNSGSAQNFPAAWNTLNSGAVTPGTGSWTKSVIDAARFGVRNRADGTDSGTRSGLVTYLYVTVDYNVAASGMEFVITYALPFLGVLSSLPTLRRVVQASLGSPTRLVRYGREELERVAEAIRAAQRGYAFLGLQGA